MILKFTKTIFLALVFLAFLFVAKPAFATSMSFNPASADIQAGKDLKVDVVISGQDESIDGVDAVVKYDDSILKVKSIQDGLFFSKYPLKKDSAGVVKIVALAPKEGVKIFGDVVVATITFEIEDSAQTSLDFSFNKGSTTDSNAPTHANGTDTLTKVSSGNYNVVATDAKLQAARARKTRFVVTPLMFFIVLLLLIAAGVYYYLKHRKPKREDVFVPEPFPLDKPPTLE